MKYEMAPKLADKWERFGQAVGLSPSQIREIKENNINEDNLRSFCDVVMIWYTEQPTPFTKYNLSHLLKSHKLIEEN